MLTGDGSGRSGPKTKATMVPLMLVAYDLRDGAQASSFRARQFIAELLGIGHPLTVVTALHPAGPGRHVEAGVVYHVLPHRLPASLAGRAFTRLACIPDPQADWARAVAGQVLGITAQAAPGCIFLSSPPHGTQVLTPLLAKSGIPVVADLRDDWLTNHRQKWPTWWHRRGARSAEEAMVRHATRVLLNTEVVRGRFVSRYPWAEARLDVLPNGYQEDDFASDEADPVPADGRRTILYTGASYWAYMDAQLGRFGKGLRAAGLSSGWKIVSLGDGAWRGPGPAEGDGPAPWIHLGHHSAAAAARAMLGAEMLLLPMPPGEREPSGTVPLKTYGYLRSGRSVVYLGEKGSTSDLLAKFRGTWSLGRSGWETLPDFVARHADEISARHERVAISRYSYRELASRLSALMSELAVSKRER
ncbi:MAG: glycosyltransferase family 4 protein [Verrucomicrobia bacterium]|nr:MAG: glycosyltransferase family 4 protein [Verrucomicrobiota bacterium]